MLRRRGWSAGALRGQKLGNSSGSGRPRRKLPRRRWWLQRRAARTKSCQRRRLNLQQVATDGSMLLAAMDALGLGHGAEGRLLRDKPWDELFVEEQARVAAEVHFLSSLCHSDRLQHPPAPPPARPAGDRGNRGGRGGGGRVRPLHAMQQDLRPVHIDTTGG